MKTALNYFRVPQTKKQHYEEAYQALKDNIKYQMGWVPTDRRIYSLTYISNKQKLTAQVGYYGQIEQNYEVVAILEAAAYIIVTKTKDGQQGPSILVDSKDVIEVQDFAVRAPAKSA